MNEYTPAVCRALELARQRAGPSLPVKPLQLLRALLTEEEGLASALLQRCGAALLDLQTLAAIPPALPDPTPSGEDSEALERLLTEAHQFAREMTADRIVASEHVLLAFLHEPEGLLHRLAGLDLVRLERELLGEHAQPLRLEEPLELTDSTEQLHLARVLDSGLNRASEAARCLEDHARFILGDALLTEELKALRHELTHILGAVPGELLLQGRDTLGDVGVSITTESEGRRHTLADVATAAARRLQQALRSLEEFGKLIGPEVGQAIEQLRYRSYTLERALVLGASLRYRLQDVKLYLLLTAGQCYGSLEWTIREAAAGGVQAFQLREKNLPDRDLLTQARQVRRWTRQAGALLIVNDRPDIARVVEADGVHLGQDDLPVRAARAIVGPNALIGVSTRNLDQLRRAVLDGASYVGIGPTFPSTTKTFTDLAGLQYVQEAAATTSLPAFAIGGITLANVDQVLAAGVRRIAVSAALCGSDQPQALAQALRQKLEATEFV